MYKIEQNIIMKCKNDELLFKIVCYLLDVLKGHNATVEK